MLGIAVIAAGAGRPEELNVSFLPLPELTVASVDDAHLMAEQWLAAGRCAA